MLVSLLVATALAADYTRKPVPGAKVTLREEFGTGPRPAELIGTTDAKGGPPSR